MKIYLFLKDEILTFSIPKKVSGSFSFDEEPDKEEKLINIEAKENDWILHSTDEVNVTIDGAILKETVLKTEQYYILQRDGKSYLIYVTDAFENNLLPYLYKENLELVIGNGSSCNINFANNLIKGIIAKVYIKDNVLTLEGAPNSLYINNKILKTSPYRVKYGDQLNIYGLKIMLLNGVVLLNNPKGLVQCNYNSAKITPHQFQLGESPKDFEVKDIDLYSKDEYFSKSPRVRRSIKTKEIDLSAPPKLEQEKEMPALLTVGPMLTMGVVSGTMVVNTLSKISAGTATMQQSWPSLVTAGAMLMSMLLWPTLTRKYNKKMKQRTKRDTINKYSMYLKEKEQELIEEEKLQRNILVENLISVEECIKIINMGRINFWDKRVEQNDFLDVRIGIGNPLLDVKVNYPEEGFTIEENELRHKADALVEQYKYIKNVPLSYSLLKNKMTAIMNENVKAYGLVHNIILQLITFYSYEDIKFVVFTNKKKESNWEYLKYLNHTFSNERSIRFFSTTMDSAKGVGDYLSLEIQNRVQTLQDGGNIFKPHYIIITDDYSQIKRHNFIKLITEVDVNLGVSLIILEDRMSKLPSKCNNFILLGNESSEILKNSFEEPEQIIFKDEVNNNVDMMQIVKKLSNIPIEFEEGSKELPDSVTFLEMEKVGKVEQLNIMNRWDTNDSTTSLKAEIGVDEFGNLMYLDLHEKFHGPHGLIAGMTGSGKSEFIITYILSMAINYSPDDVAFILIDYKGGGLAGAFENKVTGISLPHLAGTITNLDKAEMDRTLVSIDSEVKRRQQVFNEARDKLGESTIDIYKYQRFYKEGKLEEPVPHLFIICDEFAELKSQQPDFMDNLISVARIGRSLGVHLILATQKPSGVVNDQIWSNTKFRVCLKVQDTSDSNEMLKRPEAASIKQAGRFYLQVGFDEIFALGQSGWCGAKYYPSDKIVKQVDKSINFIDDMGNFVKSIQAGNNIKIEAQGEQLAAIMKNIIEVSKITDKKTRRLWLNDIDPIILVDNLEKKYNIIPTPYNVKAIIGEYDAPEKQTQGLLVYSVNTNGNTIIYGTEEGEREKLLNTMIYSMCKNHSANEINIYAIDYGSESIRMFNDFPQIGGMVFMGEDEDFKNLFKLIKEEIKTRKKLLIPYGGSIEIYNSKNQKKLPRILFIINNYDGLVDVNNYIYEDISFVGRDCERYGIVLILTCNTPSSLGRKTLQCFNNVYTLHLTDPSDYYIAFNTKCRVNPRDKFGRGLVYNGDVHEFQTASIVDDEHTLNEYIQKEAKNITSLSTSKAPKIPTLPEKVTLDIVQKDILTINKVPIGVSKESLKTIKYDFFEYPATTIASNKLQNINSFMDSLVDVFLRIQGITIFFIDVLKLLPSIGQKNLNGKRVYYFSTNFEENFGKILTIENNEENSKYKKIYIFYGIEKLKSKLATKDLEEFFDKIKQSENSRVIFCDSTKGLKSLDFDTWFSKIKNNTDGIWVGRGFGEQQNFRVSKITKEMNSMYPKDYGLYISESNAEFMKLLEFENSLTQKDDDDEE